MVVLVVLTDTSVSLNVGGSAEALATIIAGRATNGGSTGVGLSEALSKSAWTEDSGSRASRVHMDRSRVDIRVLDLGGVVVLVLLFGLGVEDTSHGHIEALALIVARGAAHGSSTWDTTLSLAEGSHSRGLGAVAKWHRHHGRVRVHIRVLQLDGVVILLPLVDLGIGLDISGVRADEATVNIIARRSTDGGTTSLGMEVTMTIIARRPTNGSTTRLGMEVILLLHLMLADASIYREEDIHVQRTWPGQQLPAVPQGFRR